MHFYINALIIWNKILYVGIHFVEFSNTSIPYIDSYVHDIAISDMYVN